MSRFPSEGFSRFASLPPADRSATVLQAAVDLFAHGPEHRRDDLALFEDLFLSVYADTAPAERLAVARKLAARPDLPPAVAAAIGMDEIGVAAEILAVSPALADIDLIRIACHRGPAHRREIARRPNLGPGVLTALLHDPEPDVIEALADNPTADLSPRQIADLETRAGHDAALIGRLTSRLPAGAAPIDVFLRGDAETRWSALATAQAEAALRQMESRGRHEAPPEAAEIGEQMLGAAIAGDTAGLGSWLSVALTLDPRTAARIAEDAGGEAMLTALAALGIDRTTATGILLHQGVRHGRTYRDMKHLEALADAIGWRGAQAVIDRWRGGPARPVEAVRQVEPTAERRELAVAPAARRLVARSTEVRRA